MDRNLRSINQDVIEKIDCAVLNDSVKPRKNVKILILNNCTSLTAIVSHSKFRETLSHSQVFVIVARFSGTLNHNELRQLNDKITTPLILQINDLKSSRLFFTNKEKNLEEVVINDSCEGSLAKQFDFNFISNLLRYEAEKFGKFSFKLLDMEIDTQACFKGKRLIDLAVEHGDMLMLKFLLLYQPNIEAVNEKKERILEIAVDKGNLKFLKTLLDIPNEAENFEAYLSQEKHRALNLMTDGDFSLLMLAALSGRNDVIVFLLRCGLNVHHLNDKDLAACDFAWDNGHHDSVIELLKADSPFPYEFDLSQLPIDSELLKISQERDLLHEQIRSNQFDDVKTFIKENPIRCVYDKRNQCALVTSLESKNFEIYSFLRSKGFTSGIDEDHKKILSQMMKNNTYHELLEADSPFPYDFDLDQLSIDSELLKINEERNLLHEQIRCNQLDPVERFAIQHPKLKCAYDNRNQCALVTALKSKNFEIYSFLRSKGFIPGIDGDHRKILSELTTTEKDELKLFNRKYFPSNENSHIMDLLSRSRLGFGNEQKNFENVQKYYEMLDEIPEVQRILQIISQAKKLDIVFDFNQKGVGDMDPTQNFEHTLVKGRIIYDNGIILIGGNSSEAEVLATMAHEFTHYAMHLLYDNQGHPYHVFDNIRKQEFTEIVDFCKTSQSKNPVIENVFTYPVEEHALELIVRVVHLLALHWKEKDVIGQVRRDFKKLFTFFSERILTDCTREIPLIKAKQRIRDLNNLLDLKRETEKSELFCDIDNIDFDEIMKSPQNILIRSTTPELILCNLLNYFKNMGTIDVDSWHIFIKREQLMDPKLGQIIRDAFESTLQPKLIVLETKTLLEFNKIKEFYNFPTMQSRIVSIMKSLLTKKTDEENFEKVFPIQHQIEYVWNDLSKISKAKILSSKLQFQGLEMALSDPLPVDSQIINELTLEEVFKMSEMRLKTFNETAQLNPEIYITRTFLDFSKQTDEPLTAENVIELLVSEKSLILADDSGMGKTVSALYFSLKLKQRNPHSWVVYIDLKQYTESYYKNDDDVPLDAITSDFFSSKILKLETRAEKKFFEHFYKNGKVILIFDGFDEIYPDYKQCILDVISAIQKTMNLLLVTTRTHLIKVLRTITNQSKILRLQTLTIENQVDLLEKIWSQSNKKLVHELDVFARLLLRKLYSIMDDKVFFGVPLHVSMLAEIYAESNNDESENFNIYTLYQKFLKKKIDNFLEKGPLAMSDNTILQTSSLNIMQVHQKLSIENFFTEDITEAFKLPKIKPPLTDKLVERIGIARKSGPGKFYFEHLSFSEFFIADFVLSNVTEETSLTKLEELHKVFLKILNISSFKMARSFMNGKLELRENLNVDVLSVKFETSLADTLNRNFLLNFVEENLTSMISFALETIKVSDSCKVSVINQRDFMRETVLHKAASSSLKCFKKLWMCIESLMKETFERKKLLMSYGLVRPNIIKIAVDTNNLGVLKEFLDIASILLDNMSFKEFITQKQKYISTNALEQAATMGRSKAFNLLWEAIENKLEASDQKDLLYQNDRPFQSLLLIAIEHRRRPYTWHCQFPKDITIAILKNSEKFDYRELKQFLFKTNYLGDTALHCAVFQNEIDVVKILWSFIKVVLHKDDQKALWQHENNIFMRSIQNHRYHSSFPKSILSVAREILSPEEIRNALIKRNSLNECFISSVENWGIKENIFDVEDFGWVATEYENHKIAVGPDGEKEDDEFLQNLKSKLKDEIDANGLKAALYENNGDTALFRAIRSGSISLIERILKLINILCSLDERLELIRPRNTFMDNTSILTHAFENTRGNALKSVCDFLIEQSDLRFEVKQLFCHRYSIHFFSNAVMKNSNCFFDVLFWFKSFGSVELEKLLLESDFCTSPRFLIDYVAEYGSQSLARGFFEFCTSLLDKTVNRKLLQVRGRDCYSLVKSLFNEFGEVVTEVWNFYVETLTPVEIKVMLFDSDWNKFIFRNEQVNPVASEILKNILVERYGEDQAKKITC